MSWRFRTVPWIVIGLSMGLCPRRASAQPLDSPSTPPVDVDSEGAAAPVREAKMDKGTRTKEDQPVEINPVFSTSGIGIELRRAW